MSPQSDLPGETILVRTPAGQKAAVEGAALLDAPQQQVLLLVNGFTPLSHLVQRLPWGHRGHEAVHDLLNQGLIHAV